MTTMMITTIVDENDNNVVVTLAIYIQSLLIDIPSLKLTQPLKLGQNPKGSWMVFLPTINFQIDAFA